MKHGKGKLFQIDGSIYEGDFKYNYLEGVGTYKWADGKIYTGNWKNN